jgi:hypothetical protein
MSHYIIVTMNYEKEKKNKNWLDCLGATSLDEFYNQ